MDVDRVGQPDPENCWQPKMQLRCTTEQVWAHCLSCQYESPRYRGERAVEAAERQARRHEGVAATRRRAHHEGSVGT